MPSAAIKWTSFECDGHTFEYAIVTATTKTRPASWPSYKASPGPWTPVLLVVVRRPGDETGPANEYPSETRLSVAHAIETARRFWSQLTQ